NSAVNNATISAVTIANLRDALLTTVLPSGGLSGFSNAISNLSLTLEAWKQISNSGTISSAANLNLVGKSPNFVIDGTSGTFSAANNINVSNAVGTAASSITMHSGD